MRKCTSCNKNISEFSEVCPYCGAKQGEKPSTASNGFASVVKPVRTMDFYAIGAGVICVLLGILSVLSYALPMMQHIPPTSAFAKLQAFDLGDIIYMAMFALLGAFILRRKKDNLLVIVTAIFGIWQCIENFSWLEPLFHAEFHIDYTLQFVLPVTFCIVLFLAVWHYCGSNKQSQLLWKLPFIVAIVCFVLKIIWFVLSRSVPDFIEIVWLPLLVVGSFLFGKWIKEA